MLNWAATELREALNVPAYLIQPRPLDILIFAYGAPGTGAAFHQHEASWCLCVRGAKLWIVYPPEVAMEDIPEELSAAVLDPTIVGRAVTLEGVLQSIELVCASANQVQPMCFVQRGGEILSLPGKWLHATVNLEDETTSVVFVKRSS